MPKLMEQRDVAKQNVLALSYTATEDINDAADVTEVLKTLFAGVACRAPRVHLISAAPALRPSGSSRICARRSGSWRGGDSSFAFQPSPGAVTSACGRLRCLKNTPQGPSRNISLSEEFRGIPRS